MTRIEPLAVLPVFFKLEGRFVVLAGGDEPATWKAELLAAAGAEVRVFAAQPCEALRKLVEGPPAGHVTLVERAWRPDDLVGAALAIGAIEEATEALAFRDAAKAAGVPINVIDKPEFCDFQFGTVVARSPLVIGISTDGAAPVLGQAIRTRLEALLPQSLRAWAQAAKDWRPAVQARNLDFRGRRRFWEAFADRAMSADREPTDDDRAACFAALDSPSQRGSLTLVGCGEGEIASVTLGAVAALQSADIIVLECDVPAAIDRLGRREAVRLLADGPQDQILTRVSNALSDGKHVAWLGLGSPANCDTWRERREMLVSLPQTPQLVPSDPGTCPCCSRLSRD